MGHHELAEWVVRYDKNKTGFGTVYAIAARGGAPAGQVAELTEEARQHGVLRTLEKYGGESERFEDYRHFANTVTRIAANYLRDKRRRERRYVGVFDDLLPAPAADPGAEAVQEALAQLPAADQELIAGSVLEGLSLDALAARFLPPSEQSPNARRLVVRRQVRAALDRLREAYLRIDTVS